MKNVKFKDILLPVLSLVIICFVISLLISATNFFTKDIIKNQDIENEKESRKVVLKDAEDFREHDRIENCYIGYNADGNIVGYTFVTEAKGYGGTITVMTGILADNSVAGIEILSQNETPGLGANAENDEFKEKYKQELPKDGFKVIKGKTASKGEIEAMTGATISTKAVTTAVNEAIDQYNTILKDGGAE